MANQQTLEQFAQLRSAFVEFPIDAAVRPQLNELSLSSLRPIHDEILGKFSIAATRPEIVPQGILDSFNSRMNAILQYFNQLRGLGPEPFVAQKSGIMQQIENYMEAVRSEFYPFTAVAIESSGVLQNFQSIREQIDSKTKDAIAEVTTKGEEILKKSAENAEKIVGKARSTAKGISLVDAQKQFTDAHKNLRGKAIGWGILSALAITAFLALAVFLLEHPGKFETRGQGSTTAAQANQAPTDSAQPHPIVETIYLATIRLGILAALGAVATFCLRMFRAHLHMNEFNLHRRRLANCFNAFLEAADSPDQRDAILMRLIDSVVAFGTSGLLQQGDDTISVPKMTVDAFMKNVKE